ncbi:NAD(P)-binding domain protein [Moelleriella libera RCEF 2490]|uniref:NAD(P)-binding domain protein n=1 Tax=Moelleriella libera RCEF 2490 TaxID=1081109 RepID=A0A168CLP6_9HYPO|nr:NAD(P)-binding domain protein [Moelleriella libera RCEF 2490]
MSKFSLHGRVAVVTGGARGIGFALAQGLAEAGASVAIFDIIKTPSADLESLASLHGCPAKEYEVDVTSLGSLEAGFAAVKRDFGGRLDICVANAGVNRSVGFLDTDEAVFQQLFAVNCQGLYFSAKLAAQAMVDNGTGCGSIIFVASIASHMALRSSLSSAYCGTKGAVRAMVAPIAAELDRYKIRVNSISPGYVNTAMTAPFPEMVEGWKNDVMNHQIAEPEDLKGACVFLASDASNLAQGTAQEVTY